MSINEKMPFLHTIFELRKSEDLILYSKIINATKEELLHVADLLEDEYNNEKVNYPFTAPAFDVDAALWAASTIYTFAQLILYRENKVEDFEVLLKPYDGAITASAMLSADLCLRFLPQVKQEAQIIDPDDPLVEIIHRTLQAWPYSGIGSGLQPESIHFETVLNNDCLKQLFTDRIIILKDKHLAISPIWLPHVKAAMGLHQSHFWKALEL
jgi:hypothetical protein